MLQTTPTTLATRICRLHTHTISVSTTKATMSSRFNVRFNWKDSYTAKCTFRTISCKLHSSICSMRRWHLGLIVVTARMRRVTCKHVFTRSRWYRRMWFEKHADVLEVLCLSAAGDLDGLRCMNSFTTYQAFATLVEPLHCDLMKHSVLAQNKGSRATMGRQILCWSANVQVWALPNSSNFRNLHQTNVLNAYQAS